VTPRLAAPPLALARATRPMPLAAMACSRRPINAA